MSGSKDGDLYRLIPKEGTHPAKSKSTPGAVRGTLLSDKNNKIDSQAEFVKVDESEFNNSYPPPYEYRQSQQEIELSESQREFAALVGEALAAGTIWIIEEVVAPRIKSWWQATVAPSLKKTFQGKQNRRISNVQAKHQVTSPKTIQPKSAVPELFTQELDEAYERYTHDMTSEEAQRELLEIFILSAIVAAKIRKLANARIKNNDDSSGEYIEGQAVVEKLSTPEFLSSINVILENNPRLLEEKSSSLTDLLGHSPVEDGHFVPIKAMALREALVVDVDDTHPQA